MRRGRLLGGPAAGLTLALALAPGLLGGYRLAALLRAQMDPGA